MKSSVVMNIITSVANANEKRTGQKHGKSQSRESVYSTLYYKFIRPLEMWFDLLLLLVLLSGGFAGFFSVPVKLFFFSFLGGGGIILRTFGGKI